jgi:hypothetical protein
VVGPLGRQPPLDRTIRNVEGFPLLQGFTAAIPHGLDRVEHGLIDPAGGKERNAVVRAGENRSATTVVQRHHDLQRPFRQTAGIVRADYQVGELIDEVHAAFHRLTSMEAYISRFLTATSRSWRMASRCFGPLNDLRIP